VIEGGRPENGPREHEKDDPGRVWQGFWNFATRTQITLTTDIKDILLALRSKKAECSHLGALEAGIPCEQTVNISQN
jgi:hypothetical protein